MTYEYVQKLNEDYFMEQKYKIQACFGMEKCAENTDIYPQINIKKSRPLLRTACGKGGIRTRGTVAGTHAFQACQLNHSCTFPWRLGLNRITKVRNSQDIVAKAAFEL